MLSLGFYPPMLQDSSFTRFRARRTFSLQAFRSIISRSGLLTRYLSSPQTYIHPSTHQSHLLFDQDTSMSDNCPAKSPINPVDFDQRSIKAESDCSGHDLQDNEGWIPISWSETANSHYQRASCYAHVDTAEAPQGNATETHSDITSLPSLSSPSLFSERLCELTPPSTPTSPLFPGRPKRQKIGYTVPWGPGEFGVASAIEEIMCGLLDSEGVTWYD
jgi:hypothetical protein